MTNNYSGFWETEEPVSSDEWPAHILMSHEMCSCKCWYSELIDFGSDVLTSEWVFVMKWLYNDY